MQNDPEFVDIQVKLFELEPKHSCMCHFFFFFIYNGALFFLLVQFEAAWRVVKLCDRNFGIGGDGVIFVMPGTNGADYTMRIFISDGSEPEVLHLLVQSAIRSYN